MIITNRRDIGYTILSRFEESFREALNNFLSNAYDDLYSNIPKGILDKAKERTEADFETTLDFF